MYQIVNHGPLPYRNESAAHERSIYSLFHLIKPLTSDFLTSSHRDRNTFKQLMSGHCIVLSLSSNLHQVWRDPFTCLVVIDWCVVYIVCGNVTHRDLVDKNQQRTDRKTGHSTLSFAFGPLPFHCFVTSRDKWSDVACARLLTAGSMSSDVDPKCLCCR